MHYFMQRKSDCVHQEEQVDEFWEIFPVVLELGSAAI
jgi:hypothetical protein